MRLLDLQRRRRDCLSIVTEAARTLALLSWGGSGKMGSAVVLSSRMVVSGPEDDAWGLVDLFSEVGECRASP